MTAANDCGGEGLALQRRTSQGWDGTVRRSDIKGEARAQCSSRPGVSSAPEDSRGGGQSRPSPVPEATGRERCLTKQARTTDNEPGQKKSRWANHAGRGLK
jgi:hypothetical protein